MIKERFENGIKYVQGGKDEMMVFSSENLDRCVEVFNATGYGNATLGYMMGYTAADLDVLKKVKARRLIINPMMMEDFSGIHTQNLLEHLRITSDSPEMPVDFAKLSSLRSFEGYWNSKMSNLFSSQSITELNLLNYVPKTGDLTEIAGITNLESLKLSYANLKSLKGIEKLMKLRTFALGFNKAAIDFKISGIDSYPVTSLSIWSSKKVNFDSIGSFAQVRILDLNEVGELSSLEPILKALPLLEELNFEDSKLKDGNNLYFLEHPSLRKISMEDKKHYLLKEEQINEALQDPLKKNALLRKK